jgi:lycopene beta-cyclase
MARYDYIITGGGAAGLSLLVHMVRSGKFSDKKILLLEKGPKSDNDRTWCFWEKEAGHFEDIVHNRWWNLWFYGNDGYNGLNDISPYEYKLIRGIDFYDYCFGIIGAAGNVEVQYGDVEKCVSDASETYVLFEGKKLHAGYIFNSILFGQPVMNRNEYLLLQHFKGWFIKSKSPQFNAAEATLMDFRVGQERGTTFVYVMPFTETEALVEYTLFSGELLPDEHYDAGLKNYCDDILGLRGYDILNTEKGVIPMTNYKFTGRNNNIINIGTVGGQTKASSGYTFKFIQKHSEAIVRALLQTGKPFLNRSLTARRFQKYDATLLEILYNNRMPGATIFTTLMKNNDMRDVLKFLDNETSVMEELKIISCLPTLTFLRSALA